MPGRFQPAPALRPYVQSYIDFDMSGWPPGIHRGMPDGSINLVVTIDGKVSTSTDGVTVSDQAVIGGIVAAPIQIAHDGKATGVQLELTPRGARVLLGLPAASIAGGVWALEDVVGARAKTLMERLSGAPGDFARAAVLDEVLLGWRRDVDDHPTVVEDAWQLLLRSGGTIGVAQLAEQMGWSRRHLTHLVRTELGVTPKLAARLFRFAAARRRLTAGDDPADAAAACGYFDQAHLTNDWKRLAGCTPGEWLAEELPFLQDSLASNATS